VKARAVSGRKSTKANAWYQINLHQRDCIEEVDRDQRCHSSEKELRNTDKSIALEQIHYLQGVTNDLLLVTDA
jgi:hypothetical protein